jgi:nuclease HARBI1
MHEFLKVCSGAGSYYNNTVGFIDGTCRPICRPTVNQQDYYSGYKKVHLLKYQSVLFPNGLIGRLDGPFKGRRHDAAILHLSRIRKEFEEVLVNEDGSWFSIYGDPGYSNQKFIKVGFKNHQKLTPTQKRFNGDMSALRVSVEYGFGKILQLFAFLDFKKNQKLLKQQLKKQYVVAGILANCHTCLNGSQVSEYFDCSPPSIEEYLVI